MQELSPIQWAMRPLKRYADFKGRAPRPEYWWFWLGYMLSVILFQILIRVSPIFGLLGLLFLGLIIPMLAVSVRRLHDINRTGFWLLVPFVPYVLGIALAFRGLSFGGGAAPLLATSGPAVVLIVVSMLLGIVLLIFNVLPGTPGPNRFGPNPYDEQNLEEIFT